MVRVLQGIEKYSVTRYTNIYGSNSSSSFCLVFHEGDNIEMTYALHRVNKMCLWTMNAPDSNKIQIGCF